jgi:multiple sugar transport system permease protein
MISKRIRYFSDEIAVLRTASKDISRKLSKVAEKTGILLGMISVLIFVGFPILWILLTAFKHQKDAYSARLLFVPTLNNFVIAFSPPYDCTPFLINTVIVAVGTVAIAIPLATLAAYAFSRYDFFAKDMVLILMIATQFIAPVVIVMPFFTLYQRLHLLDTRIGLIILYLSFSMPFAVWMIKGFIDALPTEIEEAALVDGCTPVKVLRYVTFPLIAPGVITAAAFTFIAAWNEFLFALVMTTRHSKTLTVGMMIFASQLEGIQWTTMSAVGVIIMIPVFILSLSIRDHFVKGITMGAIK